MFAINFTAIYPNGKEEVWCWDPLKLGNLIRAHDHSLSTNNTEICMWEVVEISEDKLTVWIEKVE